MVESEVEFVVVVMVMVVVEECVVTVVMWVVDCDVDIADDECGNNGDCSDGVGG